MSGFLLDTDTITQAQFGNATVVATLASHSSSDIALPVISFQEQVQGWLSRLARQTDPAKLADWYDRLVGRMFPVWCRYQLLAFAKPAILRFEQLRSLKLNGGPMDLRIAASVLENGMTVVTRNLRDFQRVPGLTSEDWSL